MFNLSNVMIVTNILIAYGKLALISIIAVILTTVLFATFKPLWNTIVRAFGFYDLQLKIGDDDYEQSRILAEAGVLLEDKLPSEALTIIALELTRKLKETPMLAKNEWLNFIQRTIDKAKKEADHLDKLEKIRSKSDLEGKDACARK